MFWQEKCAAQSQAELCTQVEELLLLLIPALFHKRSSFPLPLNIHWIADMMNYHSLIIQKESRNGQNQEWKQNKWWQGCKAQNTFIRCWRKCKMVQLFWRTVWQPLTKLNKFPQYDLTIMLFGIYSKVLTTFAWTGDVAQLAEHLPNMHKVLGSHP